MPKITRRALLKTSGLAGLAALGGGGFPAQQVHAATISGKSNPDRKLVLIYLAGGMDGLSQLVPYSDDVYRSRHNSTKIPENRLNMIDGNFGFTYALPYLWELYQRGEMALVRAVGSHNTGRSHFDTQKLIFRGGDAVNTVGTGWLYRVGKKLQEEDGTLDGDKLTPSIEMTGLSLSNSIHEMAYGINSSLMPWSNNYYDFWKESFLNGLASNYLGSDVRGVSVDALSTYMRNLGDALAPYEKIAADTVLGTAEYNALKTKIDANTGGDIRDLLYSTALLFKKDPRYRLAVTTFGGYKFNAFDTHAGMNAGLWGEHWNSRVSGKGFNNAIKDFVTALGSAWQNTAIIVFSEFGRTVVTNSNEGTDHGRGGVAMVLSGGIGGGNMFGEWPGLQNLHKNALPVTTDIRALFKWAAYDWMGFSEQVVEEELFPNSLCVRKLNIPIRNQTLKGFPAGSVSVQPQAVCDGSLAPLPEGEGMPGSMMMDNPMMEETMMNNNPMMMQ